MDWKKERFSQHRITELKKPIWTPSISVVKALRFQCRGHRLLIPVGGTEIPQAGQRG